MITVGYSTRKSNPEYKSVLQKTCMYKEIEIIEKVNNGEKSLSQVYNEILNESKHDIVVLCHDDLEFDTKRWGEKILKIFERNPDFGIVGLAGTTVMPKSGMWWEDKTKMFGIVNHKHQGKKWESRYSPSLEEELKKVVVVDGLFLVINKNNIKENFDNNVPGFHMYDINFCFNNFLKDVKIGVTTQIRVTHLSIGMTNEQWEKNREIFSKKFESVLPKKVKITNEDSLKILMITDDLNNEDNKIYKFSSYLSKTNSIELVYENSKKELKSLCKKNQIQTYNYKELPGTKIGDGKWQINQNGNVYNSNPNEVYNLRNLNYDIIISNSVKLLNIFKSTFPKTPKILFSDNDIKVHNSVKILKNSFNDNLKDFIINELNSNNEITNKIKILTGFSDKGGSTTAFINLTNYLNSSGYDCTLYGPSTWHLDKCQSDLLKNFNPESDDRLIVHFLNLNNRPQVQKVILSCHEKNLFEVGKMKQFWDEVVFLNEKHRNYHSLYNGNFSIIPNLKEHLEKRDKSPSVINCAGIIGSIDYNKQTHVSIQRALEKGFEKIYLFGTINDQNYFNQFVKPIMNEKVILHGFEKNKQKMYDMVDSVFLSSESEVASLVQDECLTTGTKFFGNSATEHDVKIMTNEEIKNEWIKILNL